MLVSSLFAICALRIVLPISLQRDASIAPKLLFATTTWSVTLDVRQVAVRTSSHAKRLQHLLHEMIDMREGGRFVQLFQARAPVLALSYLTRLERAVQGLDGERTVKRKGVGSRVCPSEGSFYGLQHASARDAHTVPWSITADDSRVRNFKTLTPR